MNIKKLFTEDRAVSPVIGVILMVAITVILAAVIGTFVLNLGQEVQQSSPQATFEINSTSLDNGNNATITHTNGDSIEAANLYANGDIANSGSSVSSLANTISGGSSVSAGDTFEVNASSDSGTIRVVWKSTDGGTSATLQSFDYE
ncbi:MAG: type IV pilin [Halobellus sp.]|uniref:type IV pilin n=1 Tax=Halobellus sp. TaxID=1979212 RepID=UPI0035D4093B